MDFLWFMAGGAAGTLVGWVLAGTGWQKERQQLLDEILGWKFAVRYFQQRLGIQSDIDSHADGGLHS